MELNPSEKAKELRAFMCLPQGMTGAGAKSCAIIAVEEIYNALENRHNNSASVVKFQYTDSAIYWQDVKTALKKL